MPRFFFIVHDGIDIHDTIGTELSGKRAIRQHMLALGAKMLAEGDIPPDGWRMEVLNTTGKIVYVMHFGEEGAAGG